MGAAIRADVLLDIVMADLTEVCVWINLRTTMRASHLADGLSTLSTEHRLGIVDSSTVGTSLSCGLTLLTLLHDLLRGKRLLWLLLLHRHIQLLLRSYGALHIT
jgi:hypothetical protein